MLFPTSVIFFVTLASCSVHRWTKKWHFAYC